MTKGWPILTTRPAGLKASGIWPFVTGSVAVLLGLPALGWMAHFVAEGIFGKGPNVPEALSEFLLILRISPMFSWVALLVALPVSAVLAARGLAGWSVAAFGGFLGGTVTIWTIDASIRFSLETLIFAMIGVAFGLFYWLAIRLFHPHAIGIGNMADKQ